MSEYMVEGMLMDIPAMQAALEHRRIQIKNLDWRVYQQTKQIKKLETQFAQFKEAWSVNILTKRIEELESELENYKKNWHCKCGGWSTPEMKHCRFCGGLRKDTWYAERIEELEDDLSWEKDSYKEIQRQKRIFAKRARERYKHIEELKAQLDQVRSIVSGLHPHGLTHYETVQLQAILKEDNNVINTST